MPSAEPHDVIQELSGAIARDPTDVQARFRRGNAYSNLGEYARAIEDMDCVLELEPDDRVARNNRGMAYLCIGEFESALPDLYRAIELDPEYRDAYHNRGPRVLRARAAGGGRGRPDAGHRDRPWILERVPAPQHGLLGDGRSGCELQGLRFVARARRRLRAC